MGPAPTTTMEGGRLVMLKSEAFVRYGAVSRPGMFGTYAEPPVAIYQDKISWLSSNCNHPNHLWDITNLLLSSALGNRHSIINGKSRVSP